MVQQTYAMNNMNNQDKKMTHNIKIITKTTIMIILN